MENIENGFVEVEYSGYKCFINREGVIKRYNYKDELIIPKQTLNHDGYPIVSLMKITKGNHREYRSIPIHILMATAFVPKPKTTEKLEVNHKDFDRANYNLDNLEWITHKENVAYSYERGRYVGKFGENNPNYGNHKLSQIYAENKEYALEKQSRKGAVNGRAKQCKLICPNGEEKIFGYQREAVNYLTELGICEVKYPETIIKKLRKDEGYMGYFLRII